MSSGKVVLGTLAGLAIGAIAGILFAPEKGSVTRKQITDHSDDYVDVLKTKIDDFRDTISAKLKNTKRDAEALAQKGKSRYDEAKRDVKTAVSNFEHDGESEYKRNT